MTAKYTLVGSDDGNVYKIDTVEFAGELWLVPIWVEVVNPTGQIAKRSIKLTGLNFQPCPNPDADYFLPTPIPSGILDGSMPASDAPWLVILDRPDDERTAKPN